MAPAPSLYDWNLRHELLVRLHGEFIADDTARLLDAVEADVTAKLVSATTDPRRERMRSLLASVRAGIEGARASAEARSLDHLRALADYDSGFLADLYDALLGGEFAKVSADSIIGAIQAKPFNGRRFEGWWRGWEKAALDRLTAMARVGAVEGSTVSEVSTDVRNAFGVSRRSAEMIARTSLSAMMAESRAEFARQNPRLNAVLWVSTLDGRTSSICASRDGRVYPVGSGPRPPAHHNCRSTVMPIAAKSNQIGTKVADRERPFVVDTRAVRDIPKGERDGKIGTTSGDTFESWLRRQDAEFISDVLGPNKARLFRDGKLSVDAFADEVSGRAWTLEELRKREAAAFARAGL